MAAFARLFTEGQAMQARTLIGLPAGFFIGIPPAAGQIEPGAPGSQSDPFRRRTAPGLRIGPWTKTSKLQKDGMTTGRSLSDQLDESGGVIQPPKQFDFEFVQSAPDVGRTPVITPRETPGPEAK
jgi:hypothetical protein